MGNLSCGCSDTVKEETVQDEEVVEFQSDIFSHPTTNPVLVVPEPTVRPQSPWGSYEGELFKYHKSSKEVLVARWCMVDKNSFKYFKSHYAALCKEKPLFEISVEKINCCKFYKNSSKFYIEISFSKFNLAMSSSSSITSFSSKPSLLYSKHGKTPSNLSVCEEFLIFLIKSKEEWENWKKVFPSNSKLIIN